MLLRSGLMWLILMALLCPVSLFSFSFILGKRVVGKCSLRSLHTHLRGEGGQGPPRAFAIPAANDVIDVSNPGSYEDFVAISPCSTRAVSCGMITQFLEELSVKICAGRQEIRT
jgi:hypothetical protein